MISFASIWAVVLRQAYLWHHDINNLLMSFYWPMLDILVWGFLGSWIQQSGAKELHNFESAAILGILLWQVVGRGANFFAYALCEELWSHNVVNLFSLPMRLTEWMIGIILYYAFAIMMTVSFCMLLVFALYDVSVWTIISTFLIFSPPLFLCGIWLGFTCLQIVVTMGKRGIELGFIVVWFLLPFCGAYYPIDVLPQWGKAISAFVPMSYVFTGMREYLMHQQNPTSYLIKGSALSILYAAVAIALFVYCFNRSKQKGLARLAD